MKKYDIPGGPLVIARTSVDRQLIVLDQVRVHRDLDLALYRIRIDRPPHLAMRTAGPEADEPVAVLGHPDGRPLSVSFGTILTERAVVS